MSLDDFLLARIAEDEAAARTARNSAPAHGVADSGFDEAVELAQSEGAQREVVQYIARHDPARVLAECEAKRRIVTKWQAVDAEWLAKRGRGQFDMDGAEDAMWAVMKALALPYADHPEYQQSWRP